MSNNKATLGLLLVSALFTLDCGGDDPLKKPVTMVTPPPPPPPTPPTLQLFVTRGVYKGTQLAQPAADAFCQAEGDTGKVTGKGHTWMAWLSSYVASADLEQKKRGYAFNRIQTAIQSNFNINDAAWISVDSSGRKETVFSSIDNTRVQPVNSMSIRYDSSGMLITTTEAVLSVWTGTSSGTATAATCQDAGAVSWSDIPGTNNGTIGKIYGSGPDWSNAGTQACASDGRLFCFQVK